MKYRLEVAQGVYFKSLGGEPDSVVVTADPARAFKGDKETAIDIAQRTLKYAGVEFSLKRVTTFYYIWCQGNWYVVLANGFLTVTTERERAAPLGSRELAEKRIAELKDKGFAGKFEIREFIDEMGS